MVPIDPELAALLRPLVAERRGNEEVFVTGSGTVVHYHSFHGRIWRPAVTHALADDAIPFEPRIHDLRHAHASWLLAECIPVLTVADRPLPSSACCPADPHADRRARWRPVPEYSVGVRGAIELSSPASMSAIANRSTLGLGW